jgi:hypothetical protein
MSIGKELSTFRMFVAPLPSESSGLRRVTVSPPNGWILMKVDI